jgi:hypothetical protein
MTNQTSFSAAEWQLLGDVPLAACAAVAVAEPGSGGEREVEAVIAGWREAAQQWGTTELVGLIARYLDPQTRPVAQEAEQALPSTAEAVLDEVLGLCRQAAALLETKATPEETEGYKQFTLHMATNVAKAAREGGLLGLGGERVSPNERRTLQSLADALRTQLHPL